MPALSRLALATVPFAGDGAQALASHLGKALTVKGRLETSGITLDETKQEFHVTGRIFHNTVTVAKGARIDGRMPWRPLNYFETLEHLREAQL